MDPSGDIERKQIFNYSSDFFLRRVDRSLSTYPVFASFMHAHPAHSRAYLREQFVARGALSAHLTSRVYYSDNG